MNRDIHVPHDLTVEQVLTLLQFLDNLIDSIYCVYADEIKDIYRQGLTVAESLRECDLDGENLDC
jgi:hypothetical protein